MSVHVASLTDVENVAFYRSEGVDDFDVVAFGLVEAPYALMVLDRNYKVRFVNNTYKRMRGVDVPVGVDIKEVFPADYVREKLVPQLDHVFLTGETVSDVVSKSYFAEKGYLKITRYPIFDRSGSVAWVGTCIVTINELEVLYKEKKEAADFMQVALTAAKCSPYKLHVSDGGEVNVHLDGSLRSMLFPLSGDKCAFSLADFPFPVQLAMMEVFSDVTRNSGGEFYSSDVFSIFVGMNRLFLRVYGKVVGDKGDQVVGVINDLTQEEMRRISLINAVKYKNVSDMLSGVVHDFSNLVVAVSGGLDLIKARLGSEAEKVEKEIKSLKAEMERGRRLIRGILDYARPVGSSGRRKVIPMNMSLEMKACAEMVRVMAGSRAKVDSYIDEGLPNLEIDMQNFRNAVMNLVANALDATNDLVGIRANLVPRIVFSTTLKSIDGKKWFSVTLSDNGMGMSEAVFKKCVELNFTTKPEGVGTGIGLPMVNEFVKSCGGYIDIKTQEMNGTSVTMFFPV